MPANAISEVYDASTGQIAFGDLGGLAERLGFIASDQKESRRVIYLELRKP